MMEREFLLELKVKHFLTATDFSDPRGCPICRAVEEKMPDARDVCEQVAYTEIDESVAYGHESYTYAKFLSDRQVMFSHRDEPEYVIRIMPFVLLSERIR